VARQQAASPGIARPLLLHVKDMTVIQTSEPQSSIIQQLQSVVDPSQVIAGDDLAEHLRDRLSRAIAPAAGLPCVVYPNTQEELVEVVRCAASHQWRMMPIGRGSKLDWGGLAHPIEVLISTERLNRLIDHAVGDLTITAEAGMSVRAIADTLHQQDQHLGLDPVYPDQATLGGMVATANTGSLRQRYGGVRDRVIGISFVRADGTLAKAGGRVVKNVAGYDMMKLMTGAYGTLGIISQLTFRVYPNPETSQTVVIAGEAEAIQSLVQAILVSSLTPQRLDGLSPALMAALGFAPCVGVAVQFASIGVSVDQQVKQLSDMARASDLSISACLKGESDAALWRQLQDPIHPPNTHVPITCKMGIPPNQTVEMMQQLPELLPVEAIAQVHLSSGVGNVQFDGEAIAPTAILKLRQWCDTHGGFLSLLEAPVSWKQQLDSWGYSGNALSMMQRIKSQFDPHHLLNPGRFVGSI
jgi:glycolate oxidase FAD binding subunit